MSHRVKLGEETRLKATVEEVATWEKSVTEGGGKPSHCTYALIFLLILLLP